MSIQCDASLRQSDTTPASSGTGSTRAGETHLRVDAGSAEEVFHEAEEASRRGNFETAIASYGQVLEFNPEHVAARVHRGLCYKALESFDLAERDFSESLKRSPALTAALINLGVVQSLQGRHDDAIASLEHAIRIAPHSAVACSNLGKALAKADRQDQAIEFLQRALELDPQCIDARINLGGLYNDLGDGAIALAHLRVTVEQAPERADAHYNLGIALHQVGQLQQAISAFDTASLLRPNYTEAKYNRSLVHLLVGDFHAGWAGYELRNQLYELRPNQFDAPKWDGSSLESKSILVVAEQGAGEEILFSTCLPEIASQAKRCLVECDARLVSLFARSFPTCDVFPRPPAGEAEPDIWLPHFDCRIGMASLPKFVRCSLEAFPRRRVLLSPCPQLCEQWRSRFARFQNRLKVGISWRGGIDAKTKRHKSGNLLDWQPILTIPDAEFVNLQYGDVDEELRSVRDAFGVQVHHWEDCNPLTDLESFAALVASLDLVISISNTTVHMAGALGVPVWTMVPHVPDWRWQLSRNDSLWYESMRLFRQQASYDWTPTIGEVSHALRTRSFDGCVVKSSLE